MHLMMFIAKRFARLILTILLISTIIFFVIRIIPGDPAAVIAGIDATDADVAAIRAKIGTDKPIAVQYASWLKDIATFDFGNSMITGQSVTKQILRRFPITLTLATLGIILGMLIAIPIGVLSAVKRWSLIDYFGMFLSQLGMAIPSFWLGIILLLLFAVKIHLFPLFGIGSIKNFILPALSRLCTCRNNTKAHQGIDG